tara:strand:- start:1143 stop:1334 length:192 start_codon:yes stop_codon:yes gene_type:complete
MKNPVSDKPKKGKEENSDRSIRGGYWFNSPFNLESTRRYYIGPSNRISNCGFRVVRNKPKGKK